MPELVLIPRGLISVLLYYSLPPEMKIKGVETGFIVRGDIRNKCNIEPGITGE